MSDDIITDKLTKPDLSAITPASSTATASAAVNGQLLETSATTVKPGHKTSEAALTVLAIVVGATLASGILTSNTLVQLFGIAQMTLAGLGYTWSRTLVKTAAALLFVAVLGHTQVACKANGPVIGAVSIDCTVDHAADIANVLDALKSALSGGGWSAVYTRAKQAGTDIGGCALAELVQDYLGGKAAPAKGEGQTARATLEKFRSEEAGGATFITPAGAL